MVVVVVVGVVKGVVLEAVVAVVVIVVVVDGGSGSVPNIDFIWGTERNISNISTEQV